MRAPHWVHKVFIDRSALFLYENIVAGYVFKEVQDAVFWHFLRGFEECSDSFDPKL